MLYTKRKTKLEPRLVFNRIIMLIALIHCTSTSGIAESRILTLEPRLGLNRIIMLIALIHCTSTSGIAESRILTLEPRLGFNRIIMLIALIHCTSTSGIAESRILTLEPRLVFDIRYCLYVQYIHQQIMYMYLYIFIHMYIQLFCFSVENYAKLLWFALFYNKQISHPLLVIPRLPLPKLYFIYLFLIFYQGNPFT